MFFIALGSIAAKNTKLKTGTSAGTLHPRSFYGFVIFMPSLLLPLGAKNKNLKAKVGMAGGPVHRRQKQSSRVLLPIIMIVIITIATIIITVALSYCVGIVKIILAQILLEVHIAK